MTTDDLRRIVAPRPPAAPAPFRFPIIASIAPLVAALALWLMTGSPFALLFAVLGPVTALASFADSRFGARRAQKRELVRFAQDVAATVAAIDALHAAERSDLAEVGPGGDAIVGREGADPYRWLASASSAVMVSAGIGSVASSVTLDSPARTAATPVDFELDEIDRRVAVIPAAPVLLDARLGIGICGTSVLAAALTRSIIVQLAWSLSPAGFWAAGGPSEATWMDALPHRSRRWVRPGDGALFGVTADEHPVAFVARAPTQGELPGECRIVIRVGHDGAVEIVQHPDRGQRRAVTPGLVSRESAVSWATRVAVEAARDGLVSSALDLPAILPLASLLPTHSRHEHTATLGAEFAADAGGAVTIDLVAQGPHAVVAGTTGSGKSELLISWVLALAARHSPNQVNFLLLDFKGGSAFDSLAVLPHSVGIITDLDASQAGRALASLRAELQHRERVLGRAGARDIRDLPTVGGANLPRLVIVADEFAAMLVDHPDLHPLFADIASRGRALGVHLILCTQRPAGIVRDGVLANADLRISLRVNNGADSSAVVGTTAAAELPADALGRGVVGFAGATPRLVQFAIAGPDDAAVIARRWRDAAPPRRPWCDPLPTRLTRMDVVGVAAAAGADAGAGPAELTAPFGLSDLPQEQRRAVACWDARRDGHVLVLGMARSGTTTALHALASGGRLVPGDVAGAWDAVEALEDSTDLIVAIDDLDSLLARFPTEYRDVFIERLCGLLRDGPTRGIGVALAAQRITADVNRLAAIVDCRLMMRHASSADFVLAGGDRVEFDGNLPAGGGIWRGQRVQVISDPDPLLPPAAVTLEAAPRERPWAIVTSRAPTLCAQLATAGLDVLPLATLAPGEWESSLRAGHAIVGDVDEWQSRWGLLSTLRNVSEIMFDRCTIADYRALTKSRELPPPISGLPDVVWRQCDDGAQRARLPRSIALRT